MKRGRRTETFITTQDSCEFVSPINTRLQVLELKWFANYIFHYLIHTHYLIFISTLYTVKPPLKSKVVNKALYLCYKISTLEKICYALLPTQGFYLFNRSTNRIIKHLIIFFTIIQTLKIAFIQVPIDVTARWAASPVDTRSPFKQLGRLEKVSCSRKKHHQSGNRTQDL